MTGLFLLAIFYTIYFLRSLLLPIVLALLLSYLLRPIVRGLARTKIPSLLGAALLLLSLVGLFGYGVSFLAAPAAGWLEKAPYSLHQLQQKLLPFKKPMEKVAAGQRRDRKPDRDDRERAEQNPTVEVKQASLADSLMVRTPEFLVSTLTMLILLYFLLAYDGVFLAKSIKLMPTLSDKKRAVSIAHEIEGQVSRYLFTITVINCCLGVAVGVTVGLMGLPNPVMWGAMVAVLNFIPYLGALTGIVCMTLGAILSYDSVGYALLFPDGLFRHHVDRGKFHHAVRHGPLPYPQPGAGAALAHLLGLDVGHRRHHSGRPDPGRVQDFLLAHRADGAAGGIPQLTNGAESLTLPLRRPRR